MKTLVLASSSPYRKAQLDKLKLSFLCCSPDIDESPHTGETPSALVSRLATSKANAVAHLYPDALIIGSDQAAVFNDKILGKPGNAAKAKQQLTSFSGHTVNFLTSVCLLNSQTSYRQLVVDTFSVKFRNLTTSEIENYLNIEQPFDCAGSFKSEGLGISLFESMQGNDPNSLIGLPLIELTTMLKKEGISPI